jgi:hypothetical protein
MSTAILKPSEQLFTVTEVTDSQDIPTIPAGEFPSWSLLPLLPRIHADETEILDDENKLAAERRKYALGLFNFHQSKTSEDKV